MKIILSACIIFLTTLSFVKAQKLVHWNGQSYEFVQKPRDWNKARAHCISETRNVNGQMITGHLASIESAEEMEFVLDLLPDDVHTIWIGGSDFHRENDWVWDDGKPMEFKNWNDGEPNGSNDENCLEMFARDHDRPGKWNDNRCNKQIRLSFVCKFSP